MDQRVKGVLVGAASLLMATIGFFLSIVMPILRVFLLPTQSLPISSEKSQATIIGHHSRRHRGRRQKLSAPICSIPVFTIPSSSSDLPVTPTSISREGQTIDVAPHLVPASSMLHDQADNIDLTRDVPRPPLVTPALSDLVPPLPPTNTLANAPPPMSPQSPGQSDARHHTAFHLSNLKPSWSLKKAKSSQSVLTLPSLPPSPPPSGTQNCAVKPFLSLKKSKTLRKAPSAAGNVSCPTQKSSFTSMRSLDKKRSQPLRTQPYEAPYFFPAPTANRLPDTLTKSKTFPTLSRPAS